MTWWSVFLYILIVVSTMLTHKASASEQSDRAIRQHCIKEDCDTPLFYRYYAEQRKRLCEKERPVLLRDDNRQLLIKLAEKAYSNGLKSSVAILPVIESSLNPRASESKPLYAAKGLWQFKPGTARDMGLVVSKTLDERMDPDKSSIAGIRYVKWLESQFNDDHNMAILAYYIGIGRLKNMIAEHGTTNPWFLSQLISGFEPGKNYLMKYHGYTLALMGKGC